MTDLVSVVEELHALRYYIEDVGNLNDYLGVQFKNINHGWIELTHPQLIYDITKELIFNPNTKPTRTPTLSRKIINKDLSGN